MGSITAPSSIGSVISAISADTVSVERRLLMVDAKEVSANNSRDWPSSSNEVSGNGCE
jgi:hypothetical protein